MEIQNNQNQNKINNNNNNNTHHHHKRRFESIDNLISKCKESKSNSLSICDQPSLSEFLGIRNETKILEDSKKKKEEQEQIKQENEQQQLREMEPSILFGDALFCESLTSLTLSRCSLTELTSTISLFPNLKQISLANNRISGLPSSFSKLKKLESLFLSLNVFKEIPLEIFELPNLSELDFDSNEELDSIPNEIEKVSKTLTKIKLSDCSFIEFPKQLSKNMYALKEIDLAKNKIKSIDVDQLSLNSLEILELSKNELEEVPRVNSVW